MSGYHVRWHEAERQWDVESAGASGKPTREQPLTLPGLASLSELEAALTARGFAIRGAPIHMVPGGGWCWGACDPWLSTDAVGLGASGLRVNDRALEIDAAADEALVAFVDKARAKSSVATYDLIVRLPVAAQAFLDDAATSSLMNHALCVRWTAMLNAGYKISEFGVDIFRHWSASDVHSVAITRTPANVGLKLAVQIVVPSP